MTRHKNETEDLLLSISQNCETLIEQTHRKAEKTLGVKLSQPRETFHFKPLVSIEGSWMIGLTSLEIYNFIFSMKNIITNSNYIQIFIMSLHLWN